MKFLLSTFVVCVLIYPSPSVLNAEGTDAKFQSLFVDDGVPQDWLVRRWDDVSQPADEGVHWSVKDGTLHGSESRGTWLMSEEEYGDFELRYEFKLGSRGNSGLALRSPLHGDPAFDGMELQMADFRYNTDASDSELTGGIYRAVEPVKQVYEPNRWNKMRVVLKGSHLLAVLNDIVIQNVDLSKQDKAVQRHGGTFAPAVKDRPARGHIGFQELSRDDERVQIRHVSIKRLDALVDESPTETQLISPDGRNAIKLRASVQGVTFEVFRDDQRLLGPSRLGCELADGGGVGASSSMSEIQYSEIRESFELPWGKTKRVEDHCNTSWVNLVESSGLQWQLDLRAYNDGVAFRYRLPEQEGFTEFAIRDEATAFDVVGEPNVLFNSLKSFTTSHESLYRRMAMSELPVDELFDCPLLLDWSNGPAAAITEARVLDFSGCYLRREAPSHSRLNCRLAPHLGHAGVSVVSQDSIQSPWRVVLLADDAGKLLESNLLLCLNDPPKKDFSWALPGKTTFHWWNGEFEDDYKTPNGNDAFVARHKKYIDFCAANGIAYHGLSGDGRAWYPQSSTSYAEPSADADVRVARPELRLPEILKYAKQRGVGIRLWVHWKPLSLQLDEAFNNYEQWGVKGLMVDFLDRDDQEMIEFTERMLTCAAEHHLNIQIHGSSKNSGEQRTFPNLFNREGVLNLEFSKWSVDCDPQHSVNVAYTRALAGPVDYHHGGFRSSPRSEFQPRNLLPTVLGSRCHNVALYVVYENPMPMVADTPDAYDGQVGFEFLQQLPLSWDETRFVAGEPGEFVAVARRSGDVWYVGGINNWTARTIDVPFDFLATGQWKLELLHDSSLDDTQPNTAKKQIREVNKTTRLRLPLASGGGFVATIRQR